MGRVRYTLVIVSAVVVILLVATLNSTLTAKADLPVSTATYRVDYTFSVEGPRNSIVLGVPLPPSSDEISWTRLDVGSIEVAGTENYTLRSLRDGLQNLLYIEVTPPATVQVSFNVIVASGDYLDDRIQFRYYRLIPAGYREYVSPTYWWNYTVDNIARISREVARSIRDDMRITDVLDLIRNVTTGRLHYTPMDSRSPVWKAVEAGTGDCSEFSDLYISLARSIGIPALRGVGYVAERWDSSKGEYVLMGHAWPIVYVPGAGWVPVEATVTVSKGLKAGVNPLDYICLYIDDGSTPPDGWNPIRGDVLLEPSERWFVGFEESLKYSNYTISSSIKVYHPERLKVEPMSGLPLPAITALLAFGTLYTALALRTYGLGGGRER